MFYGEYTLRLKVKEHGSLALKPKILDVPCYSVKNGIAAAYEFCNKHRNLIVEIEIYNDYDEIVHKDTILTNLKLVR